MIKQLEEQLYIQFGYSLKSEKAIVFGVLGREYDENQRRLLKNVLNIVTEEDIEKAIIDSEELREYTVDKNSIFSISIESNHEDKVTRITGLGNLKNYDYIPFYIFLLRRCKDWIK